MINKIVIKEIELPEVWQPRDMPLVNEEVYEERLKNLKEFMYKEKFDYIVIYGDMGEFANINFFTGFNIWLEEALLVVGLNENPFFILGNEMLDMSKNAPFKKVNRLLLQTFSLEGQLHNTSIDLKKVLVETGIKKDSRVGIIGNKYYRYYKNCDKTFDLPYYIINSLIEIAGNNNIFNVTNVMSDCVTGFKNNLSISDIAFLEYSAGLSCYGMNNILNNLRIGQNEVEASLLFNYTGELPYYIPWSMAFGYTFSETWDAHYPRHSSILKKGDIVHLGSGLRGSCIARVGIAVNSFDELNENKSGIIDIFYKPYFNSIITWYENIRIGITGGEFYEKFRELIENPNFNIALKSVGHTIHYEEWVDSPFDKGSEVNLHSGMAIQCDIFAQHRKLNTFTTVEDGIILADENLKLKLKEQFPSLVERFDKRREFIKRKLGINIHESVLLLNDLQAIMNPYFLNTNFAFVLNK